MAVRGETIGASSTNWIGPESIAPGRSHTWLCRVDPLWTPLARSPVDGVLTRAGASGIGGSRNGRLRRGRSYEIRGYRVSL